MALDTGTSSTFGDQMKLNLRRFKLECPRFDGVDFLGQKLKVEQFFEAVALPEAEKVQTVMIHLDGKAIQWHQQFMRFKGSVTSIEWPKYVLEMRARFHDTDYADPMAELVSLK